MTGYYIESCEFQINSVDLVSKCIKYILCFSQIPLSQTQVNTVLFLASYSKHAKAVKSFEDPL